MLDFDLFTRVVDETGASLVRIDFFNYGETFPAQTCGRDVRVHQAPVSADLPVHQHERPGTDRGAGQTARALGHRRGHLFSGRGIQDSSARYRQRGTLDLALRNLRAMTDEKRRAGRDLPFINWRYILFK